MDLTRAGICLVYQELVCVMLQLTETRVYTNTVSALHGADELLDTFRSSTAVERLLWPPMLCVERII